MLIRHISIPKNSHLITLKQPKQHEDFHEEKDYMSVINRTLNPEQPYNDNTLLNFDNRPNKTKSLNRTQNIIKKQTPRSGRQTPISYHQYLSNQDISPKKQMVGRFRKFEQIKNPRQTVNDIYTNPHNFSTYTPPLSKNAYLIKPAQVQHQSENDLNMFHYNRDQQGESQHMGLNKHPNNIANNSQLYKTLQKFRSKRLINDGVVDNNFNIQKKYAYSLPKHMSSQPHQQNKISQVSEEDPRIEKKNFRSKQLHITPNVNSSHLVDRKKNTLPKDDPFEQATKTIHQNIPSIQIKKDKKQQQQQQIVEPISNKKSEKSIQNIQSQNKAKAQKVIKYFEHTQPSETVIEVSYRTSLARLKQICCTPSLDKYIVTMKIPEIFSYPMFSGNEEQSELFSKAEDILKNLQVQFKTDIQLKKYTNCITIIVNKIAIIWHYTGKIYFGGWKIQMFDQGCKQGLGLQWSPKKYVYYGEYHKNKRSGIGLMKNHENEIIAGCWRDNHFIRAIETGEAQQQAKLFSIIK